ncbi:MAG: dihydroorotase [Lachnospiraceae bacterium]|nr:dihydroorotase [Lachnospiraceae bacterium]
MKLLLKQGHLVDPAAGVDEICDILVEDGKIAAVGRLATPQGAELRDCGGRYIFPGLIDMHVHLRDPGLTRKETLTTGAAAAAAGGYTTICPMPNTCPATDSGEKIAALLARSQKEACVNILPISAVTLDQAGNELVDIASVKRAGAIGLSEDGKSVMDIRLYREAMKQAKERDMLVLAHCEEKQLVGNGVINAGAKAEELSIPGISNAVEDVIAARDIFLAGETGARLHLCHCTTKATVGLVKLAKELGYSVTAEVCPHHLALCDEDIPGDDGSYKMNPPLRSREDMLAVRQGLADGIMDVISTDHAPHTAEEKAGGFLGTPFGIVGLETSFALCYTTLVRGGYMTLSKLISCMSARPAQILGISRGTLAVGSTADLCIADLSEYEIDPERFASKGRNTPFGGRRVWGKITATMVNGRFVYEAQP